MRQAKEIVMTIVKRSIKLLAAIIFTVSLPATAAQSCRDQGVWLQVLGSGGPEAGDKRASSSYLIWHNGHARVLVDFGSGAQLRFEEAEGKIEDLAAVAFTHFHVDHSGDFPALIKASFFSSRTAELPVLGPSGNHLLPSAEQFVMRLFDQDNGVWPYLSDHLSGEGAYPITPIVVESDSADASLAWANEEIRLLSIGVNHGPLPAVAWRVEIAGKSVVLSGDMNGRRGTLEKLAQQANLLVAHNAVPESAQGVARRLHMPPSVIGEIAGKANVEQVVISHRMLRTLERKEETTDFIRASYKGPLYFANDLDCFEVL